MHIDVILDTRASAGELAELGALAERYGIRGVWVSSLLDSRDPFSNLALLAYQSSAITLGPVAVNPFDTHPVRIASALLTLNEIATGRARLVIGGGGEALEALGIKPARRVRVVAECVEIVKAAASGEAVNFRGEIFQVDNLRFDWPQAKPPPLFVGASMPQMLRMAARVADGVMMSDMPVTLVAQAVATLDAALSAQNKKRPNFEVNAFAAWHIYPSRAQAFAEARRWLVLRGIFRPPVLQEFLEQSDIDLVMANSAAFWQAFRGETAGVAGVPDRVLDALVNNLTLAGSLDDLEAKIQKLQSYAAAGLSAISLRLYENPAASIKLLGEQVVPRL